MIANTQKCTNCGKSKLFKDFAKNKNNTTEYDLWCTKCRTTYVTDEETLINYCRENNRLYNPDLFRVCYNRNKEKLEKMNIPQNKFYDELIKKTVKSYFIQMNLSGFEGDVVPPPDKEQTKLPPKKNNKNVKIPNELLEKWGTDFVDIRDIIELEKLFNDMMLSFKIESASSQDYLKKICIASLMADKEMKRGQVEKAKKWIDMYDTLMKSSKLAPVQASKSDMMGVNNFSQFVEMVEKQGFIPHYPDVPVDDIDFAILCFINYNRKLIGMNQINLDELKSELDDVNE